MQLLVTIGPVPRRTSARQPVDDGELDSVQSGHPYRPAQVGGGHPVVPVGSSKQDFGVGEPHEAHPDGGELFGDLVECEPDTFEGPTDRDRERVHVEMRVASAPPSLRETRLTNVDGIYS